MMSRYACRKRVLACTRRQTNLMKQPCWRARCSISWRKLRPQVIQHKQLLALPPVLQTIILLRRQCRKCPPCSIGKAMQVNSKCACPRGSSLTVKTCSFRRTRTRFLTCISIAKRLGIKNWASAKCKFKSSSLLCWHREVKTLLIFVADRLSDLRKWIPSIYLTNQMKCLIQVAESPQKRKRRGR